MNRLQYLSKKQEQKTTHTGGVGCLTVLGLIFVTLKLTGNITWSWWWVLSPFIVQAVFLLLVLGILLLVFTQGMKKRR